MSDYTTPERINAALDVLDKLSPADGTSVKPVDYNKLQAIAVYMSGDFSEDRLLHIRDVNRAQSTIGPDPVELTKTQSVIFEALKLGRHLLAENQDINGTRPRRVICNLAEQGLKDISVDQYQRAAKHDRSKASDNWNGDDHNSHHPNGNSWLKRLKDRVTAKPVTVIIPGK